MPLPDGTITWPPTQVADLLPTMDEWSAWYEGDPQRLTDLYVARGQRPPNRPSQYRGGAVGSVARFFWGQPQHETQQRTRLHVPLAADIATSSADLLFNETVKLGRSMPGSPEPVPGSAGSTGRLERLLDWIGWEAFLLEAAEVCAGVGGAYLGHG